MKTPASPASEKEPGRSALSSLTALPTTISCTPASPWTHLHQTLGNQQVYRLLHAGEQIAPPDAPLERHAERTAERVVRMALPPAAEPGGKSQAPSLSPKATDGDGAPQAAAENEPQPSVETQSRSQSAGSGRPDPPPPESPPARGSLGPGAAMPASLRTYFEPRFGADLGAVRLHRGPQPERLATALHARAFTLGEHIAFGPEAYGPATLSGRRLLAHELTHVLQQRRGAPRALQRHSIPAEAGQIEIIQVIEGGDALVERLRSGGQARVVVRGVEWVHLTWDPRRGQNVAITIATHPAPGAAGEVNALAYGLRVQAAFPVSIYLNRGVEDFRGVLLPTLFSYDFSRVTGDIQTEAGLYLGPRRFREYYRPPPNREMGSLGLAPDADWIDPFGPLPMASIDLRQRRLEEERVERFVAGHPVFDTWQAMEAYVRANPRESFVGMLLPDGRFVARRITESDLRRLAELSRRGELEPEETPFEGSQPSFFSITGVYIHGRAMALHQLGQLQEQYYAEPFEAFMGHGESVGLEAEVYRMEGASFGRRVLTHGQALARWRELDRYTADTIGSVQTLPGHRFVCLYVYTARGLVELDERYFRGRDAFYRNAASINTEAANIVGADLLVGRRLANPALALERFYAENPAQAEDVRYFLQAELYREEEDPRFRATLAAREPLAASVGATLYDEAAARARHLVLTAIDGSIAGLQPLVEDRMQLRELVRQMPSMTAERRGQVLVSIGVPAGDRAHAVRVLGDPARAANVALGENEYESTVRRLGPETMMASPSYHPMQTQIHTTRVSLDRLHEWASDQLEGLREFREKIDERDIDALNVQGELGNEVRRQVYAAMGFTSLHPEDFPHDNATSEFMPGPLAATTLQMDTLAEQLFANHAARNEDLEFIRLIGKITALVIAMVALALVSAGIGTAVAGYFGLTGFVGAMVEVGVGALSFTLMSELAHLLITGETQSRSLLDFLGNLGTNIAFFGIFRVLQPVIAATSRALVASRGFGTAVRLTAGVRAGTQIVQTGLEFTAFLAFGIGVFVRNHDRLPRTGREWFTLVYESALTAVLMRAGAVVARPAMREIGVWARSQRLGALEAPLNEFRGDALRLERDFQTLITNRPQRMAAEGPGLAERTAALLRRQEVMLTQLMERFRTRGDAELVRQAGEELQAIRTMLETINRLGGLGALNLTPAGDIGTVLTYRPSPAAIDQLRAIYGAENVTVDAEGRVQVRIVTGGETTDLTLLPEAMQTEAQALAAQQLSLTERMQRLGSRADLFTVEPEALTQVRGTPESPGGRRQGGIRPGARQTPAAIQEAEQMVAAAETAVEAEIGRIALRTYRQFRTVAERAQALDQARQGELAGLTDAQVGEALHLFVYRAQARSGAPIERVRTIYNLSAREIRGVLFAYRAGVNLPRLRGRVRGLTVEQRNFALDTYARLMEMRIEGATDVLNEMTQSNNKFDGGLYAMEFARFEIGLERIARMERTEINPNRIVDIILTDGTRVELKAWNRWQHGSLEWQFEKDVLEVCGQNFGNPTAITRLWYVFRPPAPLEVGEIRTRLRGRLENMLQRADASLMTRMQMLTQFDMHANLVREGTITRRGARAPEPIPVREPTPPPPRPGIGETEEDE